MTFKVFNIIKLSLILFFVIISAYSRSQSLYFPPVAGNTWETSTPSSLGWCNDKIDSLLTYLGQKNSKAFILLKDGKIVIEKYYGTFTQDSFWYWASAGKSLTSFMIGIAQQEKYLSINDKTSKYLGTGWSSCPKDKEDLITIRHQLTMTTGLNDGVPDNHCTLDSCMQYLADAGTRWAYQNAPYTILDGIIQNSTGKALNTYIYQKLTSTGISGLFVKSGYNNVFFSKARSMARYGLLILNHGNWNGNQILTDTAYFNHMVSTSQTLNNSYGYLWWLNGKSSFMLPSLQYVFPGPLVPHAPADMFMALGKNDQLINVIPSMNIVLIRMGNDSGVGEVSVTLNDVIWQKLNKVMCNSVSIDEKKNISSEVMVYPTPVDDILNIELKGQNFSVQISDICGRPVFEKKYIFEKTTVPADIFSAGMYILQVVQSENHIFSSKIIVRK